ncbi:unnamed protein product [Urochloa decumbens]|uniref:Uncharacterized protein n=1 Tax=Urochloa decumbens TaxID=240449 RepID=A0ABC9DT49_9POAL
MDEKCKIGTLHVADLKDNDKAKDGSTMEKIEDPWNPPYSPCPPYNDSSKTHWEHANEWLLKTTAFVANSRATKIIMPDRTPQWVSDALWHKVPDLVSILDEDDVEHFLHFFSNNKRCMSWGFIITPETFNYIVSENALHCAKVALEGKAPELIGHRASPNCMNPYGYFPIHEAAERFSVDMVKLLFKYGASANVRTAGKEIKENLLPLHVAVENTCLHKYFEDNLFPCQDHRDYIYKLIQLLCLPEMKIFLDTTRLLAKNTDNLLDELWNYVEDSKLVQTAVLLLAAQESIRVGSSSKKRKAICKQDGFEIIMARMMKHSVALKWGMGQIGRASNQLDASSALECTALLVDLISRAGEALGAYIQKHSEVTQLEVLEQVSSILKDHGFFPNSQGIDVTNLHPFDCKMFAKPGESGDLNATNIATGMVPHATSEKGVKNRPARGRNLEYLRNSFFPYWRSVLLSNVDVTIFPAYAVTDPKCRLNLNKQHHNSVDKGSSLIITSRSLNLMGRTQQATSYSRLFATAALNRARAQQITSSVISRRLFGTAAMTLLKVLK